MSKILEKDIIEQFQIESSPGAVFITAMNDDGTLSIMKYSIDEITDKDSDILDKRYSVIRSE